MYIASKPLSDAPIVLPGTLAVVPLLELLGIGVAVPYGLMSFACSESAEFVSVIFCACMFCELMMLALALIDVQESAPVFIAPLAPLTTIVFALAARSALLPDPLQLNVLAVVAVAALPLVSAALSGISPLDKEPIESVPLPPVVLTTPFVVVSKRVAVVALLALVALVALLTVILYTPPLGVGKNLLLPRKALTLSAVALR